MKFIIKTVIALLWLGAIIPLILTEQHLTGGIFTFGVVFFMLFLEKMKII